jgi:formyl-CoA transferase
LLGEHTEDVLRDTLGYDERQISEFTQKGVFGSGKPPASA